MQKKGPKGSELHKGRDYFFSLWEEVQNILYFDKDGNVSLLESHGSL